MLWKDGKHGLHELVTYARELGFFEVFIFTNGTFPLDITQCNYIVTINGPREIHNEIRDSSYDLILKNVKNSVTKAVFASITFSKANVTFWSNS